MRLRRLIALAVLALVTSALGSVMFFAHGAELKPVTSAVEPEPLQDYSKFRHDTQQHTRMPCLVCHVRSDNSAKIKMPGHIPCSSCHQQQFAEGNSSPICYICHTQTSVKPFPGLSSFSAVFDHAKHTSQTNCATCHRPTRGGDALSIPDRANAHVTCFTCHKPDSMSGDRHIDSCSTCHQAGRVSRTSENSSAFGKGFNHSQHAREGLNCAQCHTVLRGMGRGRQVTAPAVSMHFARAGTRTCAACHDNRRAFGATNFSDCKRCHQGGKF